MRRVLEEGDCVWHDGSEDTIYMHGRKSYHLPRLSETQKDSLRASGRFFLVEVKGGKLTVRPPKPPGYFVSSVVKSGRNAGTVQNTCTGSPLPKNKIEQVLAVAENGFDITGSEGKARVNLNRERMESLRNQGVWREWGVEPIATANPQTPDASPPPIYPNPDADVKMPDSPPRVSPLDPDTNDFEPDTKTPDDPSPRSQKKRVVALTGYSNTGKSHIMNDILDSVKRTVGNDGAHYTTAEVLAGTLFEKHRLFVLGTGYGNLHDLTGAGTDALSDTAASALEVLFQNPRGDAWDKFDTLMFEGSNPAKSLHAVHLSMLNDKEYETLLIYCEVPGQNTSNPFEHLHKNSVDEMLEGAHKTLFHRIETPGCGIDIVKTKVLDFLNLDFVVDSPASSIPLHPSFDAPEYTTEYLPEDRFNFALKGIEETCKPASLISILEKTFVDLTTFKAEHVFGETYADAERFVEDNITAVVDTPELFNLGDEDDSRKKATFKHSLLLHGPPGNAKTTWVKSTLKRRLHNFVMLAVKIGDLKDVRAKSTLINYVYEIARETAPALVFIDEIDGIASRTHLATRPALLEALDSMRGFVWTVAATNKPDILDEAISRTGRIDVKVEISNPDLAWCRAIVEDWLAESFSGHSISDATLSTYAHTLTSSSVAEIAGVLKKKHLDWVLEHKSIEIPITDEAFQTLMGFQASPSQTPNVQSTVIPTTGKN